MFTGPVNHIFAKEKMSEMLVLTRIRIGSRKYLCNIDFKWQGVISTF